MHFDETPDFGDAEPLPLVETVRIPSIAFLPKTCSACGGSILPGDQYVALTQVNAEGQIVSEIDAYHGPMHGSCNAFADWTID